MTNHPYAIHFGIYPERDDTAPRILGHTPSDVEVQITLPWPLHNMGLTGFVSGSWACWGPADQETDGDKSLHLVIYTPMDDAGHIKDLHEMLLDLPETNGRWLDYAIVTTPQDWSEQAHICLINPGKEGSATLFKVASVAGSWHIAI